jgi:glycosyltransferase involved in cell wall biosynthesis
MDTPLLLLEGMASLCAVITRPLGDIPGIYGPSPFLLSGDGNMADAAQRVKEARNLLDEERQRIRLQNERLGFGLDKILNQFIAHLN